MPRAQTPNVVAIATGRTLVNPSRFKGRDVKPKKSPPLGDPPWLFDLRQRAAWGEVTANMWWLNETDRESVAAFCRVKVMIEEPYARFDAPTWNIYIRLLQVLGAAPTTRGKLLQERKLGGDDDDGDGDEDI